MLMVGPQMSIHEKEMADPNCNHQSRPAVYPPNNVTTIELTVISHNRGNDEN